MDATSRKMRLESAKRMQETLEKMAKEGKAVPDPNSSPPTCVEDVLRIGGYYGDPMPTESTPEPPVSAHIPALESLPL